MNVNNAIFFYFDAYLFHNLGCHPARGANKSVPRFLPRKVSTSWEPSAYSKISNLNYSIFSQQDVARLDISAPAIC